MSVWPGIAFLLFIAAAIASDRLDRRMIRQVNLADWYSGEPFQSSGAWKHRGDAFRALDLYLRYVGFDAFAISVMASHGITIGSFLVFALLLRS